MNLFEQIQDIYRQYGAKHFGRGLQKNPGLVQELHNLTSCWPDLNLVQRAYCVINNQIPSCPVTNKPKLWKNYQVGFGFCGRANVCECARTSVSKHVKTAKSAQTDEQKFKSSLKRRQTNLAKYGVENAGQTPKAKQAHKNTYKDPQKTHVITQTIRDTNLQKYGVINPMQRLEVKAKAHATNLEKYGTINAMSNPDVAARSVQTRKEKYEPHYLARQNYSRFCQTVVENFGVKALIQPQDYTGVQTRPEMTFECIQCHTTFIKRFDYASPPICKVCHPSEIKYKSDQELDLLNYVQSIYTGNIISGDRRLINPYEIDILIPDLNIGIEYCGLYWHSEKSGHKSWNYHQRKYTSALNKNTRLITLFSDEWLTRQDVIKRYLKIVLNQEQYSIYARKCHFQVIQHNLAREFIDQNHMIGAPQKISWAGGLFFQGVLCAVMTFRNQSKGIYELNRFATNSRIVGGASKLLTQFLNQNSVQKIISFSDNRFSQGNLYQKLGFVQGGTVPPMQAYVQDYSVRHHKLSLNKNKILSANPHLDSTNTEWQLLQTLGYDRIWDCGKIKWVMNI